MISGTSVVLPTLNCAALGRGLRLSGADQTRVGSASEHPGSRGRLRVLDRGIDISSAAGRLFFHLVGAFAELERELIVERTKAGMAIA